MDNAKENMHLKTGGFWIRFWAWIIDLVFVIVVVVAAKWFLVDLNIYVPVELTVLMALPVYAVLLQIRGGRTLGKWLCGLAVIRNNGGSAGMGRLLFRESAGKLLSLMPAAMGFIGCVFSRRRRALHDYVAGTVVVRRETPFSLLRCLIVVVVVAASFSFALDIPGLMEITGMYFALQPDKPLEVPFEKRDPQLVQEAETFSESQLAGSVTWLRKHAVDPVAYAIAKSRQHQVLIVGEMHDQKASLDYLNALIPQLYQKAGVTKIGYEFCLSRDNGKLKRLVTADRFDEDLAMEIARNQPWAVWGNREYWDVFKTVWRLNRTIGPGKKKVLIVGLDKWADMPSVGMLGFEDNPMKNCPVWEKLRVVRLVRLLPKVLSRDMHMARQVEKEIMEKGERAIVWVGKGHAWSSPQPVGVGGLYAHRMGILLRRKHGEKIFCAHLHSLDISLSLIQPDYQGPEPVLSAAIEQMVEQSGLTVAGFDIASSPIAHLRDAAAFSFHGHPRLVLKDVADGYIFLTPWEKREQCSWTPGYVTQRMFIENKPLYQAFGKKHGIHFHNADAVNRFFLQPPE